ncbi:hypothetical protein BP6252_00300 [Coleophoma cylindrospora]|uniref:Uncharacterized protein n=1 Tax=Coleophoma cylindrospora TaxID=1849047 RepID=A0A3D8SR44_9HELO|nr:hypothetical protein BP6252_00300 [Coleophoma cylindrospora]
MSRSDTRWLYREPASSKHDRGSVSNPEPSQLHTSFLFIVNELETNDNPEDTGSVAPRIVNGRWMPPNQAQGFHRPVVGDVYRWENGVISGAEGYFWSEEPQVDQVHGYFAQGKIIRSNFPAHKQPKYYRGLTVFYCNDMDKFYAACDDVSTRSIETYYDPVQYGWHPLSFTHCTRENISYALQAGDRDTVIARHASWIGQVIPEAYRPHDSGPDEGGLSGYLPLIVALVAFSCTSNNLSHVLLQDQCWRNYTWRAHEYGHGRTERRGVVVSTYTDPENREGSTEERLCALEIGPDPIFTS